MLFQRLTYNREIMKAVKELVNIIRVTKKTGMV